MQARASMQTGKPPPHKKTAKKLVRSLQIDSEAISYVIGKGGSRRQEIEHLFNCKLVINRQNNSAIEIYDTTTENSDNVIAYIKDLLQNREANMTHKRQSVTLFKNHQFEFGFESFVFTREAHSLKSKNADAYQFVFYNQSDDAENHVAVLDPPYDRSGMFFAEYDRGIDHAMKLLNTRRTVHSNADEIRLTIHIGRQMALFKPDNPPSRDPRPLTKNCINTLFSNGMNLSFYTMLGENVFNDVTTFVAANKYVELGDKVETIHTHSSCDIGENTIDKTVVENLSNNQLASSSNETQYLKYHPYQLTVACGDTWTADVRLDMMCPYRAQKEKTKELEKYFEDTADKSSTSKLARNTSYSIRSTPRRDSDSEDTEDDKERLTEYCKRKKTTRTYYREFTQTVIVITVTEIISKDTDDTDVTIPEKTEVSMMHQTWRKSQFNVERKIETPVSDADFLQYARTTIEEAIKFAEYVSCKN